jgi:hypothetical protein
MNSPFSKNKGANNQPKVKSTHKNIAVRDVIDGAWLTTDQIIELLDGGISPEEELQ